MARRAPRPRGDDVASARTRPPALLITCEHASKAVPARYRRFFEGRDALLDSHRGWDPGALVLARRLGLALRVPVIAGRWTRLLVDLNRPPGHDELVSHLLADLPAERRARLVAEVHDTHWTRVETSLRDLHTGGRPVLHLGVHSFTPVRRGERRLLDVGILFDPARSAERTFAAELRAAIAARDPRLRVRFNEPYLGIHPGLTTHLRTLVRDPGYAGIELELNQRFARGVPGRWRDVQRVVVDAVAACVGESEGAG
ncbi:MAG: N-formylglutamate amidohydrolase [Planctomycetes bacterium]|nr:N-formylglutamate amidohydrolase [Planctomycetota bacterium]